MKKLLITANVLTLCLLLFVYGKLHEAPQTIPPCNISYDYNSEPNTGAVSLKTVNDMAGFYKAGVLSKIALKDGRPNTRSVWFTVETLKKFLWQIESKSCDANCSPKELGVRIYFAAYPDEPYMNSADLSSTKKEYGSHMTLFMVPTFYQNGVNFDFDPDNIGNDKCNPLKLRDILAGPTKLEYEPAANGRGKLPIKPLILTSSEPQLLKYKKDKTAKSGPNSPNNSIMDFQNHGGVIPPDPNDGTAF